MIHIMDYILQSHFVTIVLQLLQKGDSIINAIQETNRKCQVNEIFCSGSSVLFALVNWINKFQEIMDGSEKNILAKVLAKEERIAKQTKLDFEKILILEGLS